MNETTGLRYRGDRKEYYPQSNERSSDFPAIHPSSLTPPSQTHSMENGKRKIKFSDNSDAGVCARITQACCPYLGFEEPAEVNEVEEIYTPYHPANADLIGLEQYAEKINELKQDESVMGIAFAINKEGDLAPVYIRCIEIDKYQTNFCVYSLRNDECLGDAIVRPFLQSNHYCRDYFLMTFPNDPYVGYGLEKGNIAKVWLHNVRNLSSSNYKNIGVLLNKAIHQKFADECEGRMLIDAVRNSHSYHYKLGFRAIDPYQNGAFDTAKNSLYAKYVRNNEIPKHDLGSVSMILPEKAQELWMKEIREHPIEFPF